MRNLWKPIGKCSYLKGHGGLVGRLAMATAGPGVLVCLTGWVLPHLSNSWKIVIIWSYASLHGTPNLDYYGGGWGGAVPKV